MLRVLFLRLGAVPSDPSQAVSPLARLMDTLSLFGLFAVTGMLVCDAFEGRSP